MPSLAEQIRASRRRRVRRRRAVLAAVVAVPAALAAARLTGGPAARAAAAGPTSTSTTAVTALQPGLVDAFGRAQAAAAEAGQRLTITSGYRTPEHQAELLQAEIEQRGSREEALWWVFPPDRSMHVQGLAIDVGDGPAADWLDHEGARFGLCRTLAWEWWHFEWRERWEAAAACPPPAASPDEAPPP